MLITTLKQAASFRGYWPMSMSLLPTFNTLFDVTSLSEVLGCGGGNVVKTKYIIILWWPWFILSPLSRHLTTRLRLRRLKWPKSLVASSSWEGSGQLARAATNQDVTICYNIHLSSSSSGTTQPSCSGSCVTYQDDKEFQIWTINLWLKLNLGFLQFVFVLFYSLFFSKDC